MIDSDDLAIIIKHRLWGRQRTKSMVYQMFTFAIARLKFWQLDVYPYKFPSCAKWMIHDSVKLPWNAFCLEALHYCFVFQKMRWFAMELGYQRPQAQTEERMCLFLTYDSARGFDDHQAVPTFRTGNAGHVGGWKDSIGQFTFFPFPKFEDLDM